MARRTDRRPYGCNNARRVWCEQRLTHPPRPIKPGQGAASFTTSPTIISAGMNLVFGNQSGQVVRVPVSTRWARVVARSTTAAGAGGFAVLDQRGAQRRGGGHAPYRSPRFAAGG